MKASHNSATGEKPNDLISLLLTPFVMTQSKTIEEQVESGVSYFDLRLRKNGYKKWIFASGLWESYPYIDYSFHILSKNLAYVDLTYDCLIYSKRIEKCFIKKVIELKNIYPGIQIVNVNIKPFFGKTININNRFSDHILTPMTYEVEDNYTKLDLSNWKSIIPIPKFWDSVENRVVEYSSNKFEFLDFI